MSRRKFIGGAAAGAAKPAVVANCPPCEVIVHCGERPDLPRTLSSAYVVFVDPYADAFRLE